WSGASRGWRSSRPRRPRAGVAAGTLVQAAGFASLGLAAGPLPALAAAAVIGVGTGLFFPSWASLLAGTAREADRPRRFALAYLLSTGGVGLGAAIGGLVLHTSRPETFTAAYLADAATFVGVAVAAMLTGPANPAGEAARAGYRSALRDPALLLLLAVNTAAVTLGFAQLESGVPLLARRELGLSESAIGIAFAAGTLTIVVLQWPIGQVVARVRRPAALVAAGLVWGLAWLALLPSAAPAGRAAAAQLVAFGVVFAVGECLLSPSFNPLVAEIAPAGMLGRYNAAVSTTWSLGMMTGPPLGVLLVERAARPAYLAVCGVACAALVAGGLLVRRRRA
ncbi:MAG TPA: MFS transporter, partial [Candidatus Eisenbacteria bacterium]|nr:MFS transporter [Candidatus Eisenbacteria bacterium]